MEACKIRKEVDRGRKTISSVYKSDSENTIITAVSVVTLGSCENIWGFYIGNRSSDVLFKVGVFIECSVICNFVILYSLIDFFKCLFFPVSGIKFC